MRNKTVEETIEVFELSNTWGCGWRIPGTDKPHYGFNDAPISTGAKTWMAVASGNAVRQLLAANVGTVIEIRKGAYGGTCRTIQVDTCELNMICAQYWNQVNQIPTTQPMTCHYCGMTATSNDFFGEPVCSDCGG